MTYQSPNLPGTVIDDSNWRSHAGEVHVDGQLMSRGYIERQTPYLDGVGKTFDLPLIPEEEWVERIEEKERKGLTMRDLRERAGVPVQNQNGLGYCWAYGTVQTLHYAMAKSGESVRPLRVESVAAVIKKGRNQGGWGDEALDFIREHGVCEAGLWPEHGTNYQSLRTPEVIENAKKSIVTEWYDLKPKDWNQHVSCLLYGMSMASARMWWGHLTCDIDVVVDGGEVCVLTDNSWGPSWGENGLGVIKGSKKYCDEMVSPVVMHAN